MLHLASSGLHSFHLLFQSYSPCPASLNFSIWLFLCHFPAHIPVPPKPLTDASNPPRASSNLPFLCRLIIQSIFSHFLIPVSVTSVPALFHTMDLVPVFSWISRPGQFFSSCSFDSLGDWRAQEKVAWCSQF